MAAGASYKGEFEQRWKDVLSEIEKSEGEVMLFIDELHLIMAGQGSQGGGMDAGRLSWHVPSTFCGQNTKLFVL